MDVDSYSSCGGREMPTGRDVHCAFLRSVFALFLRVQIRPILRCFALRIRNFAHFALFCAFLRSAKISHFALFCAFFLRKNFAFCAVLRVFPAQKFRSSCSAQFIEPDYTCTLCSQEEIQESTIGKKI
jgi:hypothetical protein